MFVSLFVICNLQLGICRGFTPEFVFDKEQACLDYSEEMRQQALDQLPRTAVVMFECVQFPSPI